MKLLICGILTYAVMAMVSFTLVYSMQPASHSFAERFLGEKCCAINTR